MYDEITDVMPCLHTGHKHKTEEKTSIKHNEGEVILIDFWATWCPPCQAPMAHNQKMLEDNAEKWGGKVRIVGVSIDQGTDVVNKHVDNKQWGLVEHYHRHQSKCSQTYGVSGVPHVMLLDTKGRIVFMGHPATRKNLVEDFNTLLKGEALTGDGAWVEGAAADSTDEPKEEPAKEGFTTDYDSAVISK